MAIKEVKREWCENINDFHSEFVCDTEADVATLPKRCPGSQAIVIEGGSVYFVNASGEWKPFG